MIIVLAFGLLTTKASVVVASRRAVMTIEAIANNILAELRLVIVAMLLS